MTPSRIASVVLLLAAVLAAPAPARARDHWDLAADGDDDPGTGNVLFHGAVQEHDLDAGPVPHSDEDWYLVTSHAMSSYEMVVDGTAGDLDLTGQDVQRIGTLGTEVLQDAEPVGGVLSLAWLSPEGVEPGVNYVRVGGAACAPDCLDHDRYRIRFLETTYTIPRFNNTGSQSTVVFVQNATARACGAMVFFLSDAGAVLAVTGLDLLPGELRVLGPAAQPAAQSGSIRVAHACGYGGLSGKAVSVEPSTGFAFDTEMVPRPR